MKAILLARQAGPRPRPARATACLAVTLRDVGPATFEHCALIREWLTDLGVHRVTLCVDGSTPALREWLSERRRRGDGVVGPDQVPRSGTGLVPCWLEAAGLLAAGRVLRVEVRPSDLDAHPLRTRALAAALRRAAGRRRPVAFDGAAPPELRLGADLAGVLRAP